MNWKEFLKPNWKKIVITVIFIGLIVLLFPQYFLTRIDINTIVNCIDRCPNYPIVNIPNILTIPFLLFSYLISCLIVWIYGKRKK